MNVLLFLLALTLVGACLCWLGRSFVSLVISYFVVGCVGTTVGYLGYETFRLLLGLNALAEELNNPLLRSILKVVDLETTVNSVPMRAVSAALMMLDSEQRKIALFVGTIVAVITVTLPLVVFANAIYSAMRADAAKTAVDLTRSEMASEMRKAADKREEQSREVRELKAIVASQSDILASIRSGLQSLQGLQGLLASRTGQTGPACKLLSAHVVNGN